MFDGLKKPRCRPWPTSCANGAAATTSGSAAAEVRAAVDRAKSEDAVPPAFEIALEQATARVNVGVVLVVDESGDADAVGRPCRGDIAPAVVFRGVCVLVQVERDVAVDLQVEQGRPAQSAREEMQCEHGHGAVGGAIGARIDVGQVDRLAAIGHAEHFFGAPLQGQAESRGFLRLRGLHETKERRTQTRKPPANGEATAPQ